MTETSDVQKLLSEVEALRNRTTELELQLARQRRLRRRGFSVLAAGAGVVLLVAGVAAAADGLCPGGTNGLPFCFAANSPAQATQVNHNFAQLKEWLVQKIGATGSADVTISGTTTMNGPLISNGFSTLNAMRIQTSTTSNAALAAGKALTITTLMNDGVSNNGGIEFRHDNQSQGIGFGYNTIYATGSNAQTLNLKGYAGGIVNVIGDFAVSANSSAADADNGATAFSNGTALVWSTCTNGHYVCGVGVGHNSGDNNYWTGSKLAIRCCSL
jgi:hypothetical protein